MSEFYSEAFIEVGQLGFRLGLRSIKDQPGCWEHQVDSQWWFAVNPHGEGTKCSKGATVPPHSVYVEFNGWPAAMFNAGGGTFAYGAAGNEANFVKAVKECNP